MKNISNQSKGPTIKSIKRAKTTLLGLNPSRLLTLKLMTRKAIIKTRKISLSTAE